MYSWSVALVSRPICMNACSNFQEREELRLFDQPSRKFFAAANGLSSAFESHSSPLLDGRPLFVVLLLEA